MRTVTTEGVTRQDDCHFGIDISKWTNESWDDIVQRVHQNCIRILKGTRRIDPWDACQNVLVVLLGRNFAKKYDPKRRPFWAYMNGVIVHECVALLRAIYQPVDVGIGIEEEIESKTETPLDAVERMEFSAALERARELLTPKEQEAYPRVIKRAEEGYRQKGGVTPVEYAQDTRCRLHLRRLLEDFADLDL